MNKPRITSNYWARFLADYLQERLQNPPVTDKELALLIRKHTFGTAEEKWVCSFLSRAVENYFYRFDLVHKQFRFELQEKVYSAWVLTVHTLLDYSTNYTMKIVKQLHLFPDFNLDQLIAMLHKSRDAYHSLGQKYRKGQDPLSLGWQLGTKMELLKTLKVQYSPHFLHSLLRLLPVKDIRFFSNNYLSVTERTRPPSSDFIEKYQTRHLMVNLSAITREKMLKRLQSAGINARKSPFNKWGIHIRGIHDVHELKDYKERLFEIQDDATQLAVQCVDPKPGTSVLDYCAGYGSKTLGYAICMHNKGSITATEHKEDMVKEVKLRARAAGFSNIQTVSRKELGDSGKQKYDTVIVDVPCTGTGNLDKNPEKRLLFSRKKLGELMTLQRELLEEAAEFVSEKGQLVYITSSILKEENEHPVNKFLENNKFEKYLPEKTGNMFPHFLNTRKYFSTIRFIPRMQGVTVTFLRPEK